MQAIVVVETTIGLARSLEKLIRQIQPDNSFGKRDAAKLYEVVQVRGGKICKLMQTCALT